ncbi:MAG: glutamate--tRNA ligase [Candidatus Wallbacteria bacterium]|nr:glutamate--tRNA ligase [Candidatus Wallbacteria bacterium]
MSQFRVRIAPSPTGSTHVGLVRSALFNQLFSKKNQGKFILRIEDTDECRSTKESEETIIRDLKWAGIRWDEGPDIGGPHSPYRQSERTSLYQKMARQLVSSGHAYYCFCSETDLESKKEAAMASGENPQYDGTCRNILPAEAEKRVASGENATIRFRVPHKDYVLDDLVRGLVTFEEGMVGDFIILRSNSIPIYNFAVVVDDVLMEITHVFRGEEHLSNTPRQLMLYEAFGYPPPRFGHLSILLGADRQKLSKRHGAASVAEFKKIGILPQALTNFLFLLGWSPKSDEEFFSAEEMVERFNTENLIRNPQFFDVKKLFWLNHHYLSRLPADEYCRLALPFLLEVHPDQKDADPEFMKKVLLFTQSNVDKLSDTGAIANWFFNEDISYEEALLPELPDKDKISRLFSEYLAEIGKLPILEKNLMHETLKKVGKSLSLKGKELFLPFRLALTGKEEGPGVYDIIHCLGIGKTTRRLDRFLNFLGRRDHENQL